MQIPPNFDGKTKPGKVIWLKKSLYVLKQSPMTWFGRLQKYAANRIQAKPK